MKKDANTKVSARSHTVKSVFQRGLRFGKYLPLAIALCGLSQARAATFNFAGDSGVNLTNYYIYFQASSQAGDNSDVSVTYTMTNGGSGSFGFDTNGAASNWSILTTNQVSLGDIQSIDVTGLNASRMYISYGQFGAGITYTNSSPGYSNYVAPSRFQGNIGAATPFQFFEGNSTAGSGNFDSTFIDAFSFAYAMSNNTTSVTHGLTNYNPQYYKTLIQNYSIQGTNGGYPNFVTNGSGQLVSILGNGNLTTPVQFPSIDSYLTSLASNNTDIKVGWTSNAAIAGNGRTSIQKQYGASYYGSDGTLYTNGNMAVWSTFDGAVVTNNSQVTGAGLALNTNTGLLLTNGTVQMVFWGGSNSASGSNSPYTSTNYYIASTNSYSGLAILAQGATYTNFSTNFATNSGIVTTNITTNVMTTDLNTLLRQAPSNTNPSTLLPGFSYNTNYASFISRFTNIGEISAGNAIEQQNLYIDDFFAATMLGLAGSTNIDTNTGLPIKDEYTGIWWGWTNPVSFNQVQTNSSNYDNYGAIFYTNSDGTSYGYAYSDRFLGDPSLLLDYSGSDTVTVLLGNTLLDSVPEPSAFYLFGLSVIAGAIFLYRRRRA